MNDYRRSVLAFSFASVMGLAHCEELATEACDASTGAPRINCGICGTLQCISGRIQCLDADTSRVDIQLVMPSLFEQADLPNYSVTLTGSLSPAEALLTASRSLSVGCFPGLDETKVVDFTVDIGSRGRPLGTVQVPVAILEPNQLNRVTLPDLMTKLFDADGDGASDVYEIAALGGSAADDPDVAPRAFFDRVVDWVPFPTEARAYVAVSEEMIVLRDNISSDLRLAAFDIRRGQLGPTLSVPDCKWSGPLHAAEDSLVVLCPSSVDSTTYVTWLATSSLIGTGELFADPIRRVALPMDFRAARVAVSSDRLDVAVVGFVNEQLAVIRIPPLASDVSTDDILMVPSTAVSFVTALHRDGLAIATEARLWFLSGPDAQLTSADLPVLNQDVPLAIRPMGDELWLDMSLGVPLRARVSPLGIELVEAVTFELPIRIGPQPKSSVPWVYAYSFGTLHVFDRFRRTLAREIQLHSDFDEVIAEFGLGVGSFLGHVISNGGNSMLAVLGGPGAEGVLSLERNKSLEPQRVEVPDGVDRVVGYLGSLRTSTVPSGLAGDDRLEALLRFGRPGPHVAVLRSVSDAVVLAAVHRSRGSFRGTYSVQDVGDRLPSRSAVMRFDSLDEVDVGLSVIGWDNTIPFVLDIGPLPSVVIDDAMNREPGASWPRIDDCVAVDGIVYDGEVTSFEVPNRDRIDGPDGVLVMDPVEDIFSLSNDNGWIVIVQTTATATATDVDLYAFDRDGQPTRWPKTDVDLDGAPIDDVLRILPGSGIKHIGVNLPLRFNGEVGRAYYRLNAIPYANRFACQEQAVGGG